LKELSEYKKKKDALTEDIRDLYTEVKAAGFNSQVTRDIVKIRKMDSEKRGEYFALLDTYANAVQLKLF